jgi:protoheme IX farnesyltransferase
MQWEWRRATAFWELTKPRALPVIVFTACMGFLLANPRSVQWSRMAWMALGIALAGGGSLALNQVMERRQDALMERTKNRPLPSGRVTTRSALIFGFLLSLFGYVLLLQRVGLPCTGWTLSCGLSYLLLYTPLKYRTTLSSFAGAIPGAVLPLMGWSAANTRYGILAWLLFAILFLWQIPHALVISLRYREEYLLAGMKQLPVVMDSWVGLRQLVLHLLLLVPLTLAPTLFGIAGWIYGAYSLAAGLFLLLWGIRYALGRQPLAARRLFVALSCHLPLLLLLLLFDLRPGRLAFL